MRKKVYELTPAEAALVEGLRSGLIVFDDLNECWLKVSDKEREAVELWRRICFGLLTLNLVNSEPVGWQAEVHGRLGLPAEERVELVEELRLVK